MRQIYGIGIDRRKLRDGAMVGSLDTMQKSACTRMQGCHLIDGAGHWVQQERPEKVSELLRKFLTSCNSR